MISWTRLLRRAGERWQMRRRMPRPTRLPQPRGLLQKRAGGRPCGRTFRPANACRRFASWSCLAATALVARTWCRQRGSWHLAPGPSTGPLEHTTAPPRCPNVDMPTGACIPAQGEAWRAHQGGCIGNRSGARCSQEWRVQKTWSERTAGKPCRGWWQQCGADSSSGCVGRCAQPQHSQGSTHGLQACAARCGTCGTGEPAA